MILAWFWPAVFFALGLIFGSFLNVCIYRLPRGLSVVRPRSACPGCHAMIAWYDNIPVLSWMLLGGRCRRCREPITPRYAVVELVCGALFALSYLHAASFADAVKNCILCFLLLGLTFTDAETHLLPDAMTLTGLGVALAISLISTVPGPSFLLFPLKFSGGGDIERQLTMQLGWHSLINAVLGAAVGAGVLYAIGWLYLKLRKVEGMGLGDVKLMAMVGAFIGPILTLFALCTASLAGGAYGVWVLLAVYRKRLLRYRRQSPPAAGATPEGLVLAQLAMRALELPFGVFLCTLSLVSWFFGARMITMYMGLLR